jgi:hypothetical protein
MKVIVNAHEFASFLKINSENKKQYIMSVGPSDNYNLRLRELCSSSHAFYNAGSKIKDGCALDVTGNQLKRLRRFLKALPLQPVCIEFIPGEKIKVSQFVSEF